MAPRWHFRRAWTQLGRTLEAAIIIVWTCFILKRLFTSTTEPWYLGPSRVQRYDEVRWVEEYKSNRYSIFIEWTYWHSGRDLMFAHPKRNDSRDTFTAAIVAPWKSKIKPFSVVMMNDGTFVKIVLLLSKLLIQVSLLCCFWNVKVNELDLCFNRSHFHPDFFGLLNQWKRNARRVIYPI